MAFGSNGKSTKCCGRAGSFQPTVAAQVLHKAPTCIAQFPTHSHHWRLAVWISTECLTLNTAYKTRQPYKWMKHTEQLALLLTFDRHHLSAFRICCTVAQSSLIASESVALTDLVCICRLAELWGHLGKTPVLGSYVFCFAKPGSIT